MTCLCARTRPPTDGRWITFSWVLGILWGAEKDGDRKTVKIGHTTPQERRLSQRHHSFSHQKRNCWSLPNKQTFLLQRQGSFQASNQGQTHANGFGAKALWQKPIRPHISKWMEEDPPKDQEGWGGLMGTRQLRFVVWSNKWTRTSWKQKKSKTLQVENTFKSLIRMKVRKLTRLLFQPTRLVHHGIEGEITHNMHMYWNPTFYLPKLAKAWVIQVLWVVTPKLDSASMQQHPGSFSAGKI